MVTIYGENNNIDGNISIKNKNAVVVIKNQLKAVGDLGSTKSH